jgi:uncharacterized glyoxalase superfamily protein PhnB
MSDSFQVFGISPIVAVADVRSAVDFYVNHLAFRALFIAEDGSYGVAGLQSQSVHFVPAVDEESLAATARHCSFRIRVEHLDAFWKQVELTHPPTRTRPPETKPWGIREFHILDKDGALVIVSEAA